MGYGLSRLSEGFWVEGLGGLWGFGFFCLRRGTRGSKKVGSQGLPPVSIVVPFSGKSPKP